MSTAFAVVLKTFDVPAGHLKLAGHVIVLPPIVSCLMIKLIVCPSLGFVNDGATVTFAVNKVSKTFDKLQSTTIAVGLNATLTDVV